MKLYIKSSNDGNALNKLGISQEDFDIVKEWCDYYDPDSSVGFESENGQWVTNPFMDESDRFNLTTEKAIETYGLENVKDFCNQVLNVYAMVQECGNSIGLDDSIKDKIFISLTTEPQEITKDVVTRYIDDYDVSVNQICDIDDDGKYTTFFLYTEGSGYWYWIVDTPIVKEYKGSYEAFVNDENNSGYGSSVAFFDTLDEAVADYNGQF